MNGQPEDAIAVCDAVLDYDNSYANAYYLRGNIYLQQDNIDQALDDYEQAAAHADADYEIYIQLYENLNRAGRPEDGVKYLNQALELKGKGREYLAGRGYIYFLLGDYANAKEELTQAAAIEKKKTLTIRRSCIWLRPWISWATRRKPRNTMSSMQRIMPMIRSCWRSLEIWQWSSRIIHRR